MQRINLGATLPVILETDSHRQGEQVGEAFPESVVTGDLATDVADDAAEPNARELEFAARSPELVGMGVAPNHNGRQLSHAPVALAQWHVVVPGQIDQLFKGAMAQPRIGQVGDRFRLHRGVDHDPLEITGRQCSGLVRH
jgi:hypothetical protein